jgi:hypothetical protein
VERGTEAIDGRGGICARGFGLRGGAAPGCGCGADLSWRKELRTAAAGFTEVVVAAEPSEQVRTDVPVLTIELGRDIRVRIAATAPAALVTAVIKALAPR